MGRGCGDASRALLFCVHRWMPVLLENGPAAGNASCVIAEAVISRREYAGRVANKKSAAKDAALCHELLKMNLL
jgi:hypothetical protein